MRKTLVWLMLGVAACFGQGSPAYRQAAQLPGRIVDFKADKASIAAGQSVMLIWLTENPQRVTIEPEIGRVTARGNKLVSPRATTTYKLTLNGANQQVLTKEVTVTVTGTVAATAAKVDEAPKPDFSGVYDFGRGPTGAAAPPPPQLKAGAERFKVTRGPGDAGLTADCRPLAGPQAYGVPYQFQIVQSKNHVAILHEYPGVFRIIPINGTHPVDPDPTWMGDSVARWDGVTLVIDTIGFNDKTEISGFKHTEALHIVERFNKGTDGAISYEATLEDPNVWEQPWTVKRTFAARTDLEKIGEFVCENNPD